MQPMLDIHRACVHFKKINKAATNHHCCQFQKPRSALIQGLPSHHAKWYFQVTLEPC